MRELITPEELFKQKEKINSLSKDAKKSYKTLMNLCNEISHAEDLRLVEHSSSGTDNLIFILSDRVIEHLTYTHSLLSAYRDYSKTLEKLIFEAKLLKKDI